MEDLLSSPFGLTRIRSSQEVYSKTRSETRQRCLRRLVDVSIVAVVLQPLLLLQPAPFHTSGNGSQQKERKNHSRLDYTIEIRLLSIECVSLIGQYTLKCQPGTALYTNLMLAL